MDDRFNTAAGWVLFAGIVGLGLSSVSSRIFHADSPEHPTVPGYEIVAAEGPVEGGGPSLAKLLSEADAAVGSSAAVARCGTCHTFDQGGATGTGPNLFGVMGSAIGGHAAGFAYSSALKDKGGTWTFENMDAWLTSPRAFANGTKMSFAGLGNPADRANIILYLNGQGSNLPLPVVEEEPAAEEGVDGAGEGPGGVEGGDVDAVEAAGAMGDEQPVPGKGTTAPVG